MHWHTGTIGFSYPEWLSAFYPKSTRAADYLAIYAGVFNTVELDTTFHAVPPPERVQKWAETVPQGFTFCPKVPRQITHDAPIAQGLPLMRQFLGSLEPMRRTRTLGPILLQFPPTFGISEWAPLRNFLRALPMEDRFAVELRHAAWQSRATENLLREYRCAWVAADYAVDPFPIHNTTDFLYMRFIGVHRQFEAVSHEQLDTTDRLTWWHEQMTPFLAMTKGRSQEPNPSSPIESAFTFFSNDYAGHAPATVNRFRAIAGMPMAALPRTGTAATIAFLMRSFGMSFFLKLRS